VLGLGWSVMLTLGIILGSSVFVVVFILQSLKSSAD
jgi:hypothetical protein